VLPGVTVEATSPVLTQRARAAATDGTGPYRITELLPGTYQVTFTLSGFSVVRRDGIDVRGSGVISDQRGAAHRDHRGNDHLDGRDAAHGHPGRRAARR
jgi:hypothetical protein